MLSRANSRSPLQKKRHINHIIPLRAGRNAALISALTTCIMELETDDLSGCGEPITLEGISFSRPGATAPASLPPMLLGVLLPGRSCPALRLMFCTRVCCAYVKTRKKPSPLVASSASRAKDPLCSREDLDSDQELCQNDRYDAKTGTDRFLRSVTFFALKIEILARIMPGRTKARKDRHPDMKLIGIQFFEKRFRKAAEHFEEPTRRK